MIKKYSRKKAIKNKEELGSQINEILKNSWGEFPKDFVVRHIIDSDRILIKHKKDEPIAVCSLDVIYLQKKKVYYIEFLSVKKEHQDKKVGAKLTRLMMIYAFLKNIHTIFLRPIEIMFISPNIRVLCSAAKVSRFIYPDPYNIQDSGKINEADEETWSMVKELIRTSDNPSRKIEKEGCVLHDSYGEMPWLLYGNENTPWHRDEHINNFAKRYLGYGEKADKEFVVRMQLSLWSILKYVLTK